MTLTGVEKIKSFSKASIHPTIMLFPYCMFMFFSLKIDSLVSLFSEGQSIAIGIRINFSDVSALGKDLYLVGEKIFSGFHFLLNLHSRVSFSKSFLFHLEPWLKASIDPSEPWNREVFPTSSCEVPQAMPLRNSVIDISTQVARTLFHALEMSKGGEFQYLREAGWAAEWKDCQRNRISVFLISHSNSNE